MIRPLPTGRGSAGRALRGFGIPFSRVAGSALFLFAQLTLCACARASDWPQFRGPNRDGVISALSLPQQWPKKLGVRWEIPLGEGCSSPAVVGDRVFVLSGEGEREVVQCLDVADGRKRWKFGYPAHFHSSWGDGPRATPTVDGNRVYTIGGTGELYCLRVADGSRIWHKSFRGAFGADTPVYGHSASPLVSGNVLYAHPGGRNGHSVVALNKRNGEVLWKALDDPPGYASPMFVPESPASGPRQLVVFTEQAVVSLEPGSGTLFWRYPWTTSYEQNVADPILQDGSLVVSTLSGTAALKLQAENGQPQFREAWRQRRVFAHFSCPVAADGLMFLPHSRRPELCCIEVASGRECWRYDLPARSRCGMVLAGQILFVYTDSGRLVLLEVSRSACRLVAEYDLAGRNWVPPVIARGCLWLRDRRSLKCVELPVTGGRKPPERK